MLDILLVNPCNGFQVYQRLSKEFTAIEPPLWCRLIGGYLKDRNHSVEILDADALDLDPAQIAITVGEKEPRLVCIVAYGHQPSASTQIMSSVETICDSIRLYSPDQKIALAGGHVSALPERTFHEIDVDYVCVGEGAITLCEILDGVSLDDVQGLRWKGGINGPATLITDLQEFQGSMWDELPMSQYRAHNWQCFNDLDSRQPYASIYTSLGCPYKCSFCCINAPFASNRYRMRDPVRVVAEIYHLYTTYGVKTFKIIDEMFVLSFSHVKEITNLLKALYFIDELNIWAYARVDTVTPNMLELLKDSGIKWLALGIESGSSHVRDGSNKQLKNNDIEDVVKAIQRAGINVIGNFIFGLPDDTYDSMNETFNLARDLNCEFVNFYSAMAYPGSPLYTAAVNEGQRLPETWSGYSQHSYDCFPLGTNTLSPSKILRFRDDAFHDYFTEPKYLEMIEEKFGSRAYKHILEMVSQPPLPRKILESVNA